MKIEEYYEEKWIERGGGETIRKMEIERGGESSEEDDGAKGEKKKKEKEENVML